MIDLGSGNLVDYEALGLPAEHTAAMAIDNGADLVTFSGDKLLGGPQAGLIAGKAELVGRIRKNPLKRALRLDKITLAALAEVLRLYRDPDTLPRRLPTLRLLTRGADEIRLRAQALAPQVQARLGVAWSVSVEDCLSQIGSGSLPVDTLASSALRICPAGGDESGLQSLVGSLRGLPEPVVGRVHKRALWLDLRCLEEAQEERFLAQLDRLQA